MQIIKAALAVAIGYLLGSIPFGLIVGKLGYGIDIRKIGSKNIGATNIFRTLGVFPGILVLFLDLSKGVFAVFLVRFFLSYLSPYLFSSLAVLSGMAAILGHNFSLYLRFSGGRGVATGFGVVIALFPQVALILFLIWLIILALFKYVSLASIMASASFPVLIFVFYWGNYPYMIFSILAAFVVIYRHRANIMRLLEGEEFRLGKSLGNKGSK